MSHACTHNLNNDCWSSGQFGMHRLAQTGLETNLTYFASDSHCSQYSSPLLNFELQLFCRNAITSFEFGVYDTKVQFPSLDTPVSPAPQPLGIAPAPAPSKSPSHSSLSLLPLSYSQNIAQYRLKSVYCCAEPSWLGILYLARSSFRAIYVANRAEVARTSHL